MTSVIVFQPGTGTGVLTNSVVVFKPGAGTGVLTNSMVVFKPGAGSLFSSQGQIQVC